MSSRRPGLFPNAAARTVDHARAAPTAYDVEDLDWLRVELGAGRLELDPWGSLIVTPADDAHEIAVALSA